MATSSINGIRAILLACTSTFVTSIGTAWAAEPFAMLPSDLDQHEPTPFPMLASDLPARSNTIVFDRTDSANDGTFATGPNQAIIFNDQSTASSAEIINNGGRTLFNDQSTAAVARLTANQDGVIAFTDEASAADSAIIVNGGGALDFSGNALAGDARIVANGATSFSESSGADNARVTINQTGHLSFSDFASAGTSAIGNSGQIVFSGSSNLSDASVVNNATGNIRFQDTATGGNSAFIENSGNVAFAGRANLASGAITNNASGNVSFSGNTSAGSGFIASSGNLDFRGNSTAANAEIVGNAGSSVTFGGQSSAGNASITSGSALRFAGRSNAANATITMAAGGEIVFADNASGGTARLHLDDGAALDIANASGPIGLGRLSGAGNVEIGANRLELGDSEPLVDFAGNFSDGGDGGGLTKTGLGTLNLSGQSDYRGATIIAMGTLEAGRDNSFAPHSMFEISDGATLDLADFDQEIGGLSGSGHVDLARATLTLGANDRDSRFSGVIAGADGNLIKTGEGTLVLTGANTYSGTTTIASGTLRVDGSIGGSSVFVGVDGRLGGSGRVGPTLVSGILAAAASNSLTIAGPLQMAAGSAMELGLARGEAGRITVEGAAVIDGQLLLQIDGPLSAGVYQILAAGSLTGQFEPLESDLAFFDLGLIYAPTQVSLDIDRNALTFVQVARTENQRATAAALYELGSGNVLYDQTLQQSVTGTLAAYDSLSGEIHAHAPNALIDLERSVQTAILGRLRQTDLAPGGWVSGQFSGGHLAGDGNADSATTNSSAVIGGVDFAPWNDTLFGVAAHFSQTHLGGVRASSADIASLGMGIYGNWKSDGWRIRAGLGLSQHSVDVSRSVAVGDFSGQASASYGATTMGAYGEVGYLLPIEIIAIEPYVGLSHTRAWADGYTESGARPANLSGGAAPLARTDGEIGVRLSTSHELDNGVRITPSVSIGYSQRLDGGAPSATHGFASGPSFTVYGGNGASHAASVEARVDIALDNAFQAEVYYRGSWTDIGDDHRVGAGLRIPF